MKSAYQWIDENSQSGPFDCVLSIKHGIDLVEQIQRDALATPDCGDAVRVQTLANQVDVLKIEVERYRRKWLEARKYLRAANKGAECNAIALQLATHCNINLATQLAELRKQFT